MGDVGNRQAGALKEHNNFKQGKSGAETPKKMGPATRGSVMANPVKSGGINRATKSS